MKTLTSEFKEMKQGIAELWKANPSIPNDPTAIIRDAKNIHNTMNEIRDKHYKPLTKPTSLQKNKP